jgi:hypothetical protein
VALSFSIISLRLLTGFGGNLSATGWLQLDTSAPRLREAYRDSLFGGTRTVVALANVVHLLPHKFSSLRAGRLAFTSILLSTLDGFLFRHKNLLPQTQ